jgi:hypothetical protein
MDKLRERLHATRIAKWRRKRKPRKKKLRFRAAPRPEFFCTGKRKSPLQNEYQIDKFSAWTDPRVLA